MKQNGVIRNDDESRSSLFQNRGVGVGVVCFKSEESESESSILKVRIRSQSRSRSFLNWDAGVGVAEKNLQLRSPGLFAFRRCEDMNENEPIFHSAALW